MSAIAVVVAAEEKEVKQIFSLILNISSNAYRLFKREDFDKE